MSSLSREKTKKNFVRLRSSSLRIGRSVRLLITVPLFIYSVGCINFTRILFVCGTDLVSATAQLFHLYFFFLLLLLFPLAPSLPPRRWTGCQIPPPQPASINLGQQQQQHRFVEVYFLTPIVCAHCKYRYH